MISYEKATALTSALAKVNSKLSYPPQNFVDLARPVRPARSARPIVTHGIEYTGRDAGRKLMDVRGWIADQAPAQGGAFSAKKGTPPSKAQVHVGMIVSSLSAIGAWRLSTPYPLAPHASLC
jgi:Xaa-Pro aminopeptidase